MEFREDVVLAEALAKRLIIPAPAHRVILVLFEQRLRLALEFRIDLGKIGIAPGLVVILVADRRAIARAEHIGGRIKAALALAFHRHGVISELADPVAKDISRSRNRCSIRPVGARDLRQLRVDPCEIRQIAILIRHRARVAIGRHIMPPGMCRDGPSTGRFPPPT